MQDPYFAVKEEVEQSVTVVLKLHERWLELSSSGKKNDEFEWTASELLSGMRSIEWDLQDLEDTVSIVEGNRQKFQLEESDVQARKDFIESTRKQIVALRDEVQGNPAAPGFSTKKSSGPSLPSIGKKSKGYGKVGSQDTVEMMPAAGDDEEEDDVESATPSTVPRPLNDEIIGDDAVGVDGANGVINGGNGSAGAGGSSLDALSPMPSKGRHRRKKCCIALSVITVLLIVIIAMIVASGHTRGESAKESLSEAKAKLGQMLHGAGAQSAATTASGSATPTADDATLTGS